MNLLSKASRAIPFKRIQSLRSLIGNLAIAPDQLRKAPMLQIKLFHKYAHFLTRTRTHCIYLCFLNISAIARINNSQKRKYRQYQDHLILEFNQRKPQIISHYFTSRQEQIIQHISLNRLTIPFNSMHISTLFL